MIFSRTFRPWRSSAQRFFYLAWIIAGLGWTSAEAADGKIWDFSTNGLQGWTKTQGLSAAVSNGVLVLNIQQADSHIANEAAALTPSKDQQIIIKYRASGLPPETTGQIFYGNAAHGYDGAFYWRIPSLISDGDWHEIALDSQAYFSGDFKDWRSGPITRLRLDIVDQCPGQVEIASLRMLDAATRRKILSLSEVQIESPRKYLISQESLSPRGARCARTFILSQGRYSIWARAGNNAAGKTAVDALSFDGATKLSPSFTNSDGFQWFLAGRSAGGTVTVSAARASAINLDCLLVAEGDAAPKDRGPESFPEIKSEVSPVVPNAANAVSRPAAAPYWSGYMLTHPNPDGSRPVNTGNISTYFRRRFHASADLKSAWCQITVDDYFRLYLNGEKIAENLNSNSWKTPTVIDVTSRLKPGENVVAVESINGGGPGGMLFDLTLNKADGTFEKIVSDERFVCHNQLASDWTSNSFDDRSWASPIKSTPPPAAPWSCIMPYVDETPQIPIECVSCDFQKEVTAGQAQTLTVKLKGDRPLKTNEVFYLRLEDQGEELSTMEFPVRGDCVRTLPDGTVVVSAISAIIPKYYPSRRLQIRFGIYGRPVIMPADLQEVSFAVKSLPDTGKLESRVRMVNGVPQLFVNGKVMYPVIGNCWRVDTGFDRAKANIRTFWTGGIRWPEWWIGPNQYNFASVNKMASDILEQDPSALILPILWTAPPVWWAKDHPDDISKFSDGTTWEYYRATATFSSEAWKKDAAAAMREFVRHVESSPYGSRVVGYWFIGGVSAEWQGWGCHECHKRNALMDYSPVARQAFRNFMASNTPATTTAAAPLEIPNLQERLRADLGNFRDPVKSALAIAYDQYYSESISDAVTFFARLIKETVHGKKIVGTYTGYSLEYANMNWAYHMSGHNAFRKILDSPDLDFIASPQSYGVRASGDCEEGMHAFASIRRAGKLALVDDDTRTHLCGPADQNQTITAAETEAVLRRNMGKELCRVKPICLLAINNGLNFRDPKIERDIRITGRAGQYLFERKTPRNAEIAVIVDEDSAKYVAYDKEHMPSGELIRYTHWNGTVTAGRRTVNSLTGDLIYYQRTRLAQIGAPIDYLLMSDLKKDLPSYKLWIFLSCFQYDEATRQAIESLKAKGVTALWLYAPGFIANGTASVTNMEHLTGIRFGMLDGKTSPQTEISDFTSEFTSGPLEQTIFGVDYKMAPLFYVNDPEAKTLGLYRETGKPALAVKTVGRSRFLFCGSNKVPADLLMNIARGAGVHLFSESLDFVDANDHMLMIHARNGGTKTLKLKAPCDVVDLYTGDVLQTNVDTLSFDLPTGRTRVLFLGHSGDFLKFMNYPDLQQATTTP